MHKRIVLSAMATIGFVMVSLAQTIVSTQVENRNAVLELFTGIYCHACPWGHEIAQGVLDEYPGDVSLITIQASENHSDNHPDYRTEYGDVIIQEFGLQWIPTAMVNRHVFPSIDTNVIITPWDSTYWAQAVEEVINTIPSCVNVAATAIIVKESRQMQVLVEAYYTGDSPVQPHYLNVALL